MKLVARFKKVIIKRIIVWSNAKKKYIMGTKWKEELYKFSPLRKGDVSLYFNGIIPKNAKLGEYCERCGILIGKEHINKKCKKYKGFYLCEGCKDKKKNNCHEATPDLEDIERFGLKKI